MTYVVRYLLIVLYTIFWGFLATLAGLVDRSGESVVWIGRQWVAWILWTCGIQLEVDGLENLDPEQPYVLMSNHQSVFDIAALIATLPVSWRFVAKRELVWIPLFGWALAASGHIIIDRGRRDRAIRSLERAARRIRAGTNVIVFPEGTRSPDGTLRGFKSGGFYLAISAQVPILPITVSGSSHITPKHSLRIESGVIRVRYGKPIPTSGLDVEDRTALKDSVRQAILAGYDWQLQSGHGSQESIPQAPRERASSDRAEPAG